MLLSPDEPTFAVDVQRRDDGPVVVVRGEVDLVAADHLWGCVEPLCGDHRPVVLDMSGTTFMDSAGLNVLLRAHQAQGRAPGGVRLRAPSAAVLSTLAISGLDATFPVEDGHTR
jgi:stage II sporulation protein AA (anti-sigma F factor antagonist)